MGGGDFPDSVEPKDMSKLKTKSGAKKRFRFTASGKLRCGHAGKRHNMIKRSPKQIRSLRGTKMVSASDASRVRSFLPYK